MSEIPRAAIALQVSVRVAVPKPGILKAIYVNCDRLPWMRDDSQILKEINARLDDVASQSIGVLELRKVVADRLFEVLLNDGMHVEPDIRLTLEEQIEGGFLSLAPPFDVPWLSCCGYPDYLLRESESATTKDIQLAGKDSRVVFHPDPVERRLEVHVNFEKSVWLRSFGIVAGGETLAEREVQGVMERGKHKLSLPSIAVRDYPKLGNAAAMRLTLGEGNTIDLTIQAEAWHPSQLAATLFVDLGSTRAKMLEVSASKNGGSDGVADLSRLWKLEKEDVKADKVDGVIFYGPTDTAEIIKRFGIQKLKKETLARKSDKDLGASLGEAVARLGSYYAKQGRLVTQVFWSFPCMEDSGVTRDPVVVSEAASSIASHSIIGPVTVVPEHETLKYRFQGALCCLAKLGKAKVAEQEKIKEKNIKVEKELEQEELEYQREKQKYNKTIWLFRIFKSKPTQPDKSQYKLYPDPSVEKFYKKFMRIGAQEELSDFIAMDAGGFSFDIYGCIAGKYFGKSFKAGGEDISGAIRKTLAQERHLAESKIETTEIEGLKEDACRSRKDVNRPLSRVIQSETRRIYTKPISNVVAWAYESLGSREKGIPLILTGGAMYNDFLREEIEQAFLDIRNEFTTSGEISGIVEGYDEVQVGELPRFCLVTRGFQKARMEISRDVVGGLVEYWGVKGRKR
jgi:hypothetical protein